MFSAKKQPFSVVKSAFTLIELMVVMGLIMIVMTLGIPRWSAQRDSLVAVFRCDGCLRFGPQQGDSQW